jgi:hypothetical protein
MKKILIIPLALLLVACSQAPEQSPENIEEQPEPIPVEQTEEEKEEQAEIDEDTSRLESLDQGKTSLQDCDAFNDSNAKIGCQDQYYFDQAQQKNDSSICSEIQEPQNKSLCQEELS